MKQKRILKTTSIVGLALILLLLVGSVYVNRVVTGSGDETIPDGCKLIEANGYTFTMRTSGNEQDVPVILLHGFPESSVMWKKLMTDLNQSGYYTIAPNQRGYSLGARPEEVEQYKIEHLAKDVISIADSMGIGKFHLVAHDWGSAVGWQIAAKYSDRLLSYTALSVPHINAFAEAYQKDSLQYEASKYMRGFQKETIPEFVLAKNNYEKLRTIWSKHEEKEIASYIKLFSQKNALTNAINWYRANYGLLTNGSDIGKVSVPVLFLWGTKDVALLRSGAELTQNYVSDYYKLVELNASHWLIQEVYDEVLTELSTHLSKFK